MPYRTYNANGITDGLKSLSGIFAPDPSKLIAADLARQRRENIQSQMQLREQQIKEAERGNAAATRLSQILSDLNYAATPQGRAEAMSLMPAVKGGMQYGPRFAIGANTFVNPNQFDAPTLSTMLAGAGENYANTPEGFRQKEANDLEQERVKQAAIAGRGGYKGVLQVVNPKTSDDIWTRVKETLAPKLNGYFGDTNISPEAEAVMRERAASVYQSTRNVDLAVRAAVDMASQMPTAGDHGIFDWFDNKIVPTPEMTQNYGQPAVSSPAAAPARPAAVAPAAQAAPPKYTEGQVLVNAKGERIQLQGNKWVPVK